jgi:hypothetical protein
MKSSEDFNFELTSKLWQKLFSEVMFSEAVHALMNYACLNKFMPHPSELLDYVAKFKNPEAFKSPEIAWEEVSKAIKRFGYYRQTEAFATFDDKTKRVVKAVGWSNLCHSERVDLVKRNFCDLWNTINTREREQERLPYKSLQEVLADAPVKQLKGD